MSFSINWPPGFVAQTCDPESPFFVGSKGAERRRSHQPVEASQAPWSDAVNRPVMAPHRLRVNSTAWRIFDVVRRVGAIPRGAIACHLGVDSRRIDDHALNLVQAGVFAKAIASNKSKRSRNQLVTYSIGKTPVVEVQK